MLSLWSPVNAIEKPFYVISLFIYFRLVPVSTVIKGCEWTARFYVMENGLWRLALQRISSFEVVDSSLRVSIIAHTQDRIGEVIRLSQSVVMRFNELTTSGLAFFSCDCSGTVLSSDWPSEQWLNQWKSYGSILIGRLWALLFSLSQLWIYLPKFDWLSGSPHLSCLSCDWSVFHCFHGQVHSLFFVTNVVVLALILCICFLFSSVW